MSCQKKVTKITAIVVKPIIVVITLLLGLYFSLLLNETSNLSEKSLMVLIILSVIFSILLPNLNRMESISLLKGELVLRKIEAKESAIKELAELTLDALEANRVKSLQIDPNPSVPDPFPDAVLKLREIIK